MAFADVDGDADLDLIRGDYRSDRLYLNDGNGTFTGATAVRLPPDDDRTGLARVPGAHDRSLVGAPVHARALLLQLPTQVRLTNVTGDRAWR